MGGLQITEYHNIRVLTTQQLAECYGTTADTITKNFNRNKNRYIEGKHYIALEGDNKNDFLNQGQFDRGLKNAKALYLWTEKGAFLHAKSLNTDEAWEIYDRLVETYFKVKESVIDISQLSPELRMFNTLFQSVAQQQLEQERQKAQIEQIGQNQAAIAETFQAVNDLESFQKWANSCVNKIADSPNFKPGESRNAKYSLARSESYERLAKKRNCRLDDRVQRAKGRALEERPDIKKADLNKINKLYVIANDKDLRPAYELVLKEMMLYYCVKTA